MLQCLVQMFCSAVMFAACMGFDMNWMHPVTNEVTWVYLVHVRTLCSHGFFCTLQADMHVHTLCSSLTFPIDLNQIDKGSRCLVVITSREYSQPTRNQLVVKLPIGMTSVKVLLPSPNMNRNNRLWHRMQNLSHDFSIISFLPTGKGRWLMSNCL